MFGRCFFLVLWNVWDETLNENRVFAQRRLIQRLLVGTTHIKPESDTPDYFLQLIARRWSRSPSPSIYPTIISSREQRRRPANPHLVLSRGQMSFSKLIKRMLCSFWGRALVSFEPLPHTRVQLQDWSNSVFRFMFYQQFFFAVSHILFCTWCSFKCR